MNPSPPPTAGQPPPPPRRCDHPHACAGPLCEPAHDPPSEADYFAWFAARRPPRRPAPPPTVPARTAVTRPRPVDPWACADCNVPERVHGSRHHAADPDGRGFHTPPPDHLILARMITRRTPGHTVTDHTGRDHPCDCAAGYDHHADTDAEPVTYCDPTPQLVMAGRHPATAHQRAAWETATGTRLPTPDCETP